MRASIIQTSIFTKLWRSLSDTDHDSWCTFANLHLHSTKFRGAKKANAYMWFVALNSNRFLIGQAALSTAPAYSLPDTLTVVGLTFDNTQLVIQVTPSSPALVTDIIILAAPPQRPHCYFSASKLRFIGYWHWDDSNVFDMFTLYRNKFILPDPMALPTGTHIPLALVTVRQETGLANAAFKSTGAIS
jgi:hypothetical protein